MVAVEQQRGADKFTLDPAATDGIKGFQNNAAGALAPDEAFMRLVEWATGACRVVLPTAGISSSENRERLQVQRGERDARPNDETTPHGAAPNPVERLKKGGVAACRSGTDREPGTPDRKDLAEAAHLIAIEEREGISRIWSSSLPKANPILHDIILRQITSCDD